MKSPSFKEGFFDTPAPQLVPCGKTRYLSNKKKFKQASKPTETGLLSEKDIEIFAKKLQNLIKFFDDEARRIEAKGITQRSSPSRFPARNKSWALDSEIEESPYDEDTELISRLEAANQTYLSLKYLRTLRNQKTNRHRAAARSVKKVINVRADRKWCAEHNHNSKHHTAMVSTVVDPYATPRDRIAPQASAFETDIDEATDDRPSTISPSIPRSPSSVAFNAWSNISNFMRPSPAPIEAPIPAPTPGPAQAQTPTSAPPESPEGDIRFATMTHLLPTISQIELPSS
jgi:hypothetical protein